MLSKIKSKCKKIKIGFFKNNKIIKLNKNHSTFFCVKPSLMKLNWLV